VAFCTWGKGGGWSSPHRVTKLGRPWQSPPGPTPGLSPGSALHSLSIRGLPPSAYRFQIPGTQRETVMSLLGPLSTVEVKNHHRSALGPADRGPFYCIQSFPPSFLRVCVLAVSIESGKSPLMSLDFPIYAKGTLSSKVPPVISVRPQQGLPCSRCIINVIVCCPALLWALWHPEKYE
jgi:hypothetical protein